MKTLLIIIDGAAGKPPGTALQKANTLTLDGLVRKSRTGLMQVLPGIPPESDEAVLSILGNKLEKYYGRGVFEAVGDGFKFKDGMLALRCNFATADNTGEKLIDRRVARSLSSKEAKQLEEEINEKVRLTGANFVFKATVQHRAYLVIKKKKGKLSNKITNTDPAYAVDEKGFSHALKKYSMKVLKAKPINKQAVESARLVNEFVEKAFKVLNESKVNEKRKKKGLLPANMLLLRGAANKLPRLVNLSKKYGKKFAIMADMPMEEGIAKLSGMKVVKLPASTPYGSAKDYKQRAKIVVDSLKKFDFIYIHLKGPDLYAHDLDCEGKKESIELVDKAFLKPLLKNVNLSKTVIAITADHATPCKIGAHTADPVPILVYSPKIRSDGIVKFSEKQCVKGSIKITARQLMPMLMRLSK